MVLTLGLFIASALGTLIGNLSMFFIVGTMAKRMERQQKQKFLELQEQISQMAQKEHERMRNYVKMES